ncbi:DNA polymerase I [Shouchella lehensis]|uniref:DNA polymerase I n=1 Tax=Shouchella lehensis TaxID=300825 RepID=A0A4Y7WR21_9BACI|nr:DNA polymerase I [Shouchella lehensis]MBG9783930.1 DNA polymerase I [Shouchella lehensis]TES51106.1 DNA polymerase I [Shouchella lehensis]
MKKLVLIDGNSIAYRAFFALPLLSNEKGDYTNAVYGFTTMLLKVLEEEKPTHLLVAFDAGKSTFRHKTYAAYKGTRQKTPSELSGQIPMIHKLLDAFSIKRYEAKEYEADDIIGTQAVEAAKKGYEVVVITGDKDLLQLVDDRIEVVLTRKGITEVDRYNEAKIEERYGLTPKQIIDLKGLMGDTSDNIPGVPGVGEKTAIKLLTQFSDVETVLASINEVSGKKLKERLEENKELAILSKQLATIMTEVPLETALNDLAYNGFDYQAVKELFKAYAFNSLLNRIGEDEDQQEEALEEVAFEIVSEIKEDHLISPSALVIEMLGDNYHHADIIGVGLANKNGNYFIPTKVAVESTLFQTFMADEKKEKYLFDAKRAVVALAWQDIELNGVAFDLQMASYLLDPSLSSHEMSDIASRKGSVRVLEDETVYGKGAKQGIPAEQQLAEHLSRKAYAMHVLKEILANELKENEQYSLFAELEMPLSVILGRMEKEGIKVDRGQLQTMGGDLSTRLADLEKEIHKEAGETFNINSPKQLGQVLFETLELPPVKKTKTGYSTSADVLEKLAGSHPIIEHILLYRQLGKLYSTYIEGLLKVANEETGKVHTRFNQALTQTGRLSSTDPNLQNIPIRLEEGRKIRKAFVPSHDDWLMVSADYSQIELRVLAHISGDERMKEAFLKNMDIHTKTAMDVFHVEEDEVTDQMRRSAKAVNFGIVYGISDYGLSQNLNITRKEAKEFIDRYLASYPDVKAYMENVVKEAKKTGYVQTLLARRRYLPELASSNFNQRSFAERTAMNTPIQGTAADIIKQAMVIMSEELANSSLKATMLLQVHDELIFEVAPEDEQALKELVTNVMENALSLDVPLQVDVLSGSSWYDAK